VKIFGREPALWSALAGAIVYFLGAFVFHLSAGQESVLIAVAAAGLGLIVAWMTHDGQSAAILGFVKAGIALALGFGLKLDADHQAILLSFAAAIVGMFVRTQVTAPVGPAGATPAVQAGS
jgi:hypothetical protein